MPFWVIVSNTLNVKEIVKIYLIEQKIYPNHRDEWYVYHSDLSCYVSDCTVSVSLRWVICLSQWFIMLCLWLYCISITKKSDMSITVIYHAMSLTVLYQYHQDEWYVYHSDLSCYVSDCTVSVSCYVSDCTVSCYVSDCTVSVSCYLLYQYHAMFLTVLYQYHAIFLTVLYQYHAMFLTVL
jgi:hypothetical protein